jgi:hypothetical protein
MKRAVIISLLLLSYIGAAAQSELPSVPRIPSGSLYRYELPALPYSNRYNDFDVRALPGTASFGLLLLQPLPPASFPFEMPGREIFILHDRYRRQEGITIPPHSVNYPRMIMANRGYMPLWVGEKSRLGLTGSRERYPSMGFSNALSAGYVWAPADGITLHGNLGVSDNMYHLTRFKQFNVSARARMRVADGIWVNGYGAYSVHNGAGPRQLPPGMFQRNSFGGTIEVKVTDGFGLEGGAFREYDPFTRRWITTPYFMPVFY